MNCVMIVSKAFTTLLLHPVVLQELGCNRLKQIPEGELLHWPWYHTPGVLLPYQKVLQG